jgi:hypothetical protein
MPIIPVKLFPPRACPELSSPQPVIVLFFNKANE